MQITLDIIYGWTTGHDGKQYRDYYDFSSSLHMLSLDATEPYYNHLCLPRSFTPATKLALQKALSDYSAERISTDVLEETYLVTVYRRLEAAIGWPATRDIGEWSSASTNHDADKFTDAVVGIMNAASYGEIQVVVPPRIERYWALRELLQDSFGYLWDEELEPAKLTSSWDRRLRDAHYDPIEEENTWNASSAAGLGSSLIQERIAWENACLDPTLNDTELEEVNQWVNIYRPEWSLGKPPVQAQAAFLRPHIKAEYLARGTIHR